MTAPSDLMAWRVRRSGPGYFTHAVTGRRVDVRPVRAELVELQPRSLRWPLAIVLLALLLGFLYALGRPGPAGGCEPLSGGVWACPPGVVPVSAELGRAA